MPSSTRESERYAKMKTEGFPQQCLGAYLGAYHIHDIPILIKAFLVKSLLINKIRQSEAPNDATAEK